MIETEMLRLPTNIGDGIYWSAHYNADTGQVINAYIGAMETGPLLQYSAGASDRWTGHTQERMEGAWTPIYSRGDYGRRYAYGGHWSGHCNNLHVDVARSSNWVKRDAINDIILIDSGRALLLLPPGISGGDATLHDLDCSGGWAIWYPSAIIAMEARLTLDQCAGSTLPSVTKDHLLRNQTSSVMDRVMDVLEAYNL